MPRRRTGKTKFAREEQADNVQPVEEKPTQSESELSGEDWRDLKTAGQCLNHLCLSEELSDISFTFKDDPDVKLPAHKFVLSMRSSVFKAMFYGPLAERGSTVLVEDVNPDAMKVLLRFIYSDDPELSGNNVLRCLYAAKKYCLQGLIEKCSTFLENNINADNVCTVHKQAEFYDMKPLQQKCFDFILEKASDVFMSKSFLEISHDTLVSLLKSDKLSEDEEKVFSACMKWAKNQCELDNNTPSSESIRKTLGDALYNIRFPTMSMDKFATVVTPTEILTSADQIMLYQYFATNGSSPLNKFTSRKRTGKVIMVDLPEYNVTSSLSLSVESCLRFRLTNSFQPLLHRRTKVRLKSLTGKFVPEIRLVTHTSHRTMESLGFSTSGNELTFHTPVHITDSCCFEFTRDVPCASVSIDINERKIVQGETIYINRVPYGLKSISFVQ